MLTKEDNELLCRVGPGTPMGEMLRQYWHPILLSTELPEPDCAPIRVRLLSEDLIAFRDSTGRVGMLANNCPHRGASLFFGRNEECGLRCVYHGWKFEVDGRCVDMPSEPAESNFKDKIKTIAYPCEERGGVVWCYMGSRSDPPALPDIPFFLVPRKHQFFTKRLQESNFVQAIEGGIDTTHASFLHTRLNLEMAMRNEKDPKTNRTWGDDERTNRGLSVAMKSRSARFELRDTNYGVMIASKREASDEETYWRINQFLFPYWTMPPSHAVVDKTTPKRGGGGHAFVPMDDENTITWSFTANFQRPFTDEELAKMYDYPNPGLHAGVPAGLLPATSAPMGAFRGIHNKRNDYGLDYELQRTSQFCGIPDRSTQDNAVQESMGAIYDRTKEHLGVSDTGVIHMRRRMLDAAKALRDRGQIPPGADMPEAFFIGACGFIIPKSESWIPVADDLCSFVPGADIVLVGA
jgi:phenylpropionate dioxygenase-like ring-hydroxylating dioxygenase large terminal subunit